MSITGLIWFIIIVLAYAGACRFCYWYLSKMVEPDDDYTRYGNMFFAAVGGLVILFAASAIVSLFMALVFPGVLK